MTQLSKEAQERMDHYLDEVRSALRGCRSVEADEVERDVSAHIEEELQGTAEPVSLGEVNAVLQRLGSPLQWVPKEELPWWRRMILQLRAGPEDYRLAYISFGLLIVALLFEFTGGRGWGRRVFLVLLAGSFCASRAALSLVANGKELLRPQKWLLYPSLIIVYVVIAFLLLVWPAFLLAGAADWLEHEVPAVREALRRYRHQEYWLLACLGLFITAIVGLWWMVLGFLLKRRQGLVQRVFRPFAKRQISKWARRLIWMGLVAAILSTAACIVLMARRPPS